MSLQPVSFVLSVLALAVALLAYLGSSEKTSSAPADEQHTQQTNVMPTSSADRDASINELVRRIATLESRLQTLAQNAGEGAIIEQANAADAGFISSFSMTDPTLRYKSDPAYTQARNTELHNVVTDPNEDAAARIAALQELFAIAMSTQNIDSLDTELINPVLELTNTTDDPVIKVQAWETLRMFSMQPQLIETLQEPMKRLATEDSNPYLRRLALEGLQTQLFSFEGREASNDITELMLDRSLNDSDESVRRMARQALAQAEQFKAMIEQQSGQQGTIMFDAAPLGTSSGAVFID